MSLQGKICPFCKCNCELEEVPDIKPKEKWVNDKVYYKIDVDEAVVLLKKRIKKEALFHDNGVGGGVLCPITVDRIIKEVLGNV